MSIEEWKRPLQKIELFETDKHGELVATTTVGERLDRVLNTHRALKPEGGIAKMAERREKRAKPEQKPKTTYTPPPPKYDRMTEWNWSAEVGNRYVPMSFACPSFKEKVT